MNEKSKLFNYQIIKNISFCSQINSISSKRSNNNNKIKTLKIISQNLLGLSNQEFFIKKRLPYIINNLSKIDADIYLLQEVSNYILQKLKESNKFKNYYFSVDIISKNKENQLETLIISKINPLEFKSFYIGGISNYNNSFSIIRFKNIIITNIYVQSGNYDSPYLREKWKEFQKCRILNLNYIKKYIYKKFYKKCKNIIFTGDFNFDINENNLEKKVMLEEYFKMKQNNYEELFSEDTTKNFFRFNLKQKEKRKQYDGFFICGNIISSKPKLINTKPICYLNKKESNLFINKLKIKFNDIKIKLINKQIPIFLSDHFGVICNLHILDS
tara:strand:- start:11476 stop:12462 length:987 start_codon:yes stop_codon:yes gene_type:complete